MDTYTKTLEAIVLSLMDNSGPKALTELERAIVTNLDEARSTTLPPVEQMVAELEVTHEPEVRAELDRIQRLAGSPGFDATVELLDLYETAFR